MTTIYLIRHGQKHRHAGNPSLTEVGINQAKQTGKYLSQFPISKIISSPTKRTIETAKNIAEVMNLEYSSDKNLIERMDWTDSNVTRSEFLQEWIKATNNRDYIPKYGDSSKDTGKRVSQLINKITDSHVVLVTHSGAIFDYLRNIFGDEKLSDLRKQYDEGEDYQMQNCAINKIVIDDKPMLVFLNFVEHLSELSE
ncbi:histidine phosphatase family protein [Patescibacteria group bacterium]|nr:histidine phosphatase family protein [Patescibacteria group bacterium]MBU1885851.1 histidine phosphatase family protein [Patescibacteria group bacterium]